MSLDVLQRFAASSAPIGARTAHLALELGVDRGDPARDADC
jgi:hypothetical protein